jgi:high affinity Mn2+ porin
MRRRAMRCALVPALALAAPVMAQTPAPDPEQPASDPAQADWFAVHGQATFTLQGTPGFPSPYAGPNSLTPRQRKETIDATLYAGVQPWRGGELWVNPEVDQGFGLSNTLGVAGFPSAEAYKVGKKAPYLRLQRLFFRQTLDLGGDAKNTDAGLNQFAAHGTANRLVLTVGKFGVGDVFDTNTYAHDPRNDFLNWALVDAGSFDYAADAWGYSTGAALEWYRGPWTVRFGAFNLSKVPNGETLESDFSQYQLDGEIEHRHTIGGREGAVRITVFRNRGRFGRFDDALALAAATGGAPDTALVRRRSTRTGVSFNLEQALSGSVGLFSRGGIANGQIEPYDFTDIDRTVSAGLSIKGNGWGRKEDELGIAAVVNGISKEHERYLDAGGLGVLVGDGRLPHPGAEAIGELYYRWAPIKAISLTVDYQIIGNPGYNRDRGPVNVFGVRLHAEL